MQTFWGQKKNDYKSGLKAVKPHNQPLFTGLLVTLVWLKCNSSPPSSDYGNWEFVYLSLPLYRFYLDPLNLHHVFLYISLLLLHDYNVKHKTTILFSFCKLRYNFLEFNSWKKSPIFDRLKGRNKSDQVWNGWRCRCRCHCRWFSSLMIPKKTRTS